MSAVPPSATTWTVAREDPVAWRRGRRRYGVWVLDADTQALRERLAAARRWLGDGRDGWLWPTQRQPHVTVWVGGFLCDVARHEDDLPPAVLATQQAALQASALPPFTLHVGGLASFDAAAYLQVHDPSGALARLRAVLQDGRGEFRATPYHPHVTVGLYRAAVPMASVHTRMQAFDAPPLALAVRAVRLVSYDAAVIDGPLRGEWCQPLRCATLR